MPNPNMIIPDEFEFEYLWEDTLCAIIRMKNHIVTQELFTDNNPFIPMAPEYVNQEALWDFFRERTFDPNNGSIPEILAAHNLDYYEPFCLCRAYHGRSCRDHLWFRFKGENLTWSDVS